MEKKIVDRRQKNGNCGQPVNSVCEILQSIYVFTLSYLKWALTFVVVVVNWWWSLISRLVCVYMCVLACFILIILQQQQKQHQQVVIISHTHELKTTKLKIDDWNNFLAAFFCYNIKEAKNFSLYCTSFFFGGGRFLFCFNYYFSSSAH